MNKQKIITFSIYLLMTGLQIQAQSSVKQKARQKERGLTDFPALTFASIPGAPKLSKPILIRGTEQPVIAQGNGIAAPAFYDWDGDGLKDLLVGEFGSGVENGKEVGHFIRVYKNVGTEEKPEFTGQWDYARPPFKMPGNGTPYSIDQFCCMGFTPQFIDLNNDELPDMITGSYYGEVYWFPGSKEGFEQGNALDQQPSSDGVPRNEPEKNPGRKAHQYYWLYSSACFGDLTGDGLPDLVVGGLGGLRISKNVGTSTVPKFGMRELLLDVSGKPLKIHEYTEEELKRFESLRFLGYTPYVAGNEDCSPYVVDWDNDGVPDLLVTNSYVHKGLAVVDFFKGVKTGDDIRFQSPVALFTTNTGKAFPGMGPRVFVTDWNNDGMNDLLVGMDVPTRKGKYDANLAWTWAEDRNILGPGKAPATGYVFVLLGSSGQ